MPRERVYRIIERTTVKNGKTITRIYARSSYKDRRGQRHTLWRSGETRTEAKQRLKEALEEVETKGDEVVGHARSTFADFARYFQTRYIIPAKYKGDIKVEGLRSHKEVGYQLKPLVAYFGQMYLRDITHDDISAYKAIRLNERVQRGTDAKGNPIMKERAVASVHRELALLRRMFNVAVSIRWIHDSPFTQGDSLISLAGEVQRQRILTRAEEERIFTACDMDKRRAHLKPILMCLMDTGMRRNEAFRLTWNDVDFTEGVLRVISFKGKVRFERLVGMTDRLKAELIMLHKEARGNPDDLVFGVVADIKRSWATVRRIAGLEDVRLHDLRHHAATNYIRSGVSLAETGRLLGHKEPKTTYRYVNIDLSSALTAANRLNELRKREDEDN
jgi:integrase